MILSNSEESSIKKIIIALFFLILPVACDGDRGNGGEGGGNGGQPAQVASPCDGFVPTMTGTNGNDVLTGTPGDDIIVGLAGNDTIDGLGGNDRLCGDAGNDNIMGGPGIDVLDGGPGDDIVDGGEGDDILLEAPGSDDIYVGIEELPQSRNFLALEEVSFTNAVRSISYDISSDDVQVIDGARNTFQSQGIFPNVYGSFHPDSFFFSNSQALNGLTAHLFDPPGGTGSDVFVIDAQGSPANVIQEISMIPNAFGGLLTSDTTIRVGDTEYKTIGIETIPIFNFPPIIIDDSDGAPEFVDTGFTDQPGDQGFNNTFKFSAPGDGNTATWTFSDLPNGPYLVSTTWDPFIDRATNAPFTIQDGGDPIELRVNQEEAPNDFEDADSVWKNLALLDVNNNNLVVELSDDADQFVLADAIRIERIHTDTNFFMENSFDIFQDNAEFFPPLNVNDIESTNGFLGYQLVIPSDTTLTITFDQEMLNRITEALRSRNTEFFVVSKTYAPQPGASTATDIIMNLNGNTTTKIINQTGINDDFSAANGSVSFENLFICRVPDDGGPPEVSIISNLSFEFKSTTPNPALYDALVVAAANGFEFPQLGIEQNLFEENISQGGFVGCQSAW